MKSYVITNKSSEYATHRKMFFLVFLLILSERERGAHLVAYLSCTYISHSPLYNFLELPADLSTLLVGLGGLSPELVRDRIPLDLPEGNFTLLKKVCIQ